MCGIWAYYSKDEDKNGEILNNYEYYYNQLKARGPDMTRKISEGNISFVFHRLAINDLHQEACMPFEYKNVLMMCNGEIYNHKELEDKYNIKPNTTCDCEIIVHLYHILKEEYISNINEINYNKIIYKICNLLDGEFAFIIYDKETKNMFFGRDPYGVRPLFIGVKDNSSDIILSSELKGINTSEFITQQVKSGSYGIYYINKTNCPIKFDKYTENIKIDDKLEDKSINGLVNTPNKKLYTKIREFFIEAVEKRVKNSDRKVACLLSGGLDSSLVASISSRYFEPYTLETYCIGLEGSPDMIAAQQVADFIKSKHTNIIITEKDMLNAIEEVIRIIESYDTTTVRASIGNYLVAKYISENSDAKVLLTGEYSDEIFFSYIYSKYMDKERIFYEENWRLVNNIQYYDSLRADRVISGNGLEARVPFSDRKFLEYVMNIHPSIKMPKNCQDIEKFILRKAFDDRKTLPDEILWRVKEAFSDGISTKTKSWFEILQEYIEKEVSDNEYINNKDKYTHIKVKNKEMYYYVKIFSKYYQNQSIIPELWVPRNKDGKIFTHEPSARILKDIYE